MKTILVPIDFSDVTTRVIETAQTMAAAHGARLVLLHVSEPEPDFVGFEPGPMAVRATIARDFRKEHQLLDELRTKLTTAGQAPLALHVQGPLVDKVLDQAREHGADLIIMGSHGHGAFYEFLVGSVTSGVLRGAECPVMVVPVKRQD